MTAVSGSAPAARFIGPYRVVALIGVGASSTVYRAVRPADGLQVALKLLADNHSVVPESRRRFADEARVMLAIAHPAIAHVHEVGETDSGQPYIVMELADRGDLRSRVEELETVGQSLTASDVHTVARHLADALGALHHHDVVHRDLSPGNLLIRHDRSGSARPPTAAPGLLEPDEKLLLADLGFAKILEDGSGLTRGGGTPGFHPPEQRGTLSQVDTRADVYSATAIIDWLVDDSDLVPVLDPFLTTGMADDPAARHPDMQAWFADLDQHLRRGPGATATPGSRRRSGRPPLVVAALAASGACLAALLGWLVMRQIGTEAIQTAGAPTDQSASIEGEDAARTSAADRVSAGATDDGASGDEAASSAAIPTIAGGGAVAPTTVEAPPTSSGGPRPSPSATVDAPASPATTTTTAGETTTENPFPFSPRAYVSTPADGAEVRGDLSIEGTAVGPVGGIESVQLTIRRQADTTYWNPDLGEFTTAFVRFDVPVDAPGANEVTWAYDLATSQLEPGPYRLRVWARGSDGAGDPIGAMVLVEIAP
ncbi:MAG: protein kinase [Actinomycetota bacterium]